MQPRTLTINERYAFELGRTPERRSTSGLANPSEWLIELMGGNTSASGVHVNDQSAITLAAVYTCNRILAESMASLKIGLYRNMSNGDVLPATGFPEEKLIAARPSTLYTSYTFRSTAQFHLGLRGNAYARIIRQNGRIVEYRLLHPTYVRPFFFEDKLFYEIQANPLAGYSKQEIVLPEEILHIRALSTDGIVGLSPITVLRDTIGMGLATRNYANKILKNGGVMRGFLTHPGKLSSDQVESTRENFKKPMLSGEIPVLENGMGFETVTLKPADAEFINTAKLTRNDIFGAYRIPPHMGGDLERATFSNIEQQSLEFVQYSINPWAENWEQELNWKAIPVALQGEYFYSFDLDGMLRGDTKARTDYYVKARNWGWMSVNEIRAKENMPFIEGGDTYLTPLNMIDTKTQDLGGGNAASDNNNPQSNGQGQ